ncbi:MAG: HD family phosphohydrolase [Saprospirales bacterium]|jgi:predicted metal-dependent HD superfamily phosphohydrolase|nr:HD family phosphohydrolase [Saprospirales bacterium]
MRTTTTSLLKDTEAFVQAFFAENVPHKFVFHDFEHTVQTVAAAKVIGEGCQLDEHTLSLLLLATWFHDTGYAQGPEDHEDRSCNNAERFLRGKIADDDIDTVLRCIRATRVPQQPQNLPEQIICDADLSHLGMDIYWDRNSRLRQEFALTRGQVMNDQEWMDFELNFMLTHEYHTAVAQEMLNKRKGKHIQRLMKQKRRLNPEKAPTMEELALLDESNKSGDIKKVLRQSENELKLARFGRGVETMYRTTYRTHTNLSTLADSKANLMITVNTLVIGIVVSNLLPKLLDETNHFNIKLGIPSGMLLATCLGSIIFATLSTRPKVTEGKVTREAIKQRKANLLFFGNFYNMPLEEFQWGVNEMLKDPEFLYSSMSRDLYFLGIVLAKKYRYLALSYNVFMFGLILSLLSFAISFAL